ncbi:hypothetical protein GCM10007874_64130 [Labrys miyagiensis]|uniref:Uncharacterized protein n=1 Tax=Labrys miyagiensis TaxID=346912 RepID=A0ABQ6CUX6_9HYPH|nr:hypothetical protein [Labrys miyagiensis]GLS23392.1 hypothetical protein GCM10007874_64130 [Labrys miyagiensis]
MQEQLSEDETMAAEPSDYQPPAEVAPSKVPPATKTGLLNDHVFERLVQDEEDVVGLLAYSLSMQNKRDWLLAFHKEVGRDPTPAELAAYDIGERIERRLMTYRKLAEHALSGNAFWASATLTPVSELPGAPAIEPSTPAPAKNAGKQGWFGGKSR